MQLTYVSFAVLGFLASVMALPAQDGSSLNEPRNVCWCNCGSRPDGYCIVNKSGCGRECEYILPRQTFPVAARKNVESPHSQELEV
ncbi:hypothetical protein QBC43DRAFT_303640 [Cladorrhinum sp. PSN259]|nr:hypothetical protein QBC43DRAFT_303640 [Cladorrhinum sp. PSN259]